jgi:hypothetical protein
LTTRPTPRESGRVPKPELGSVLAPSTLEALRAAVTRQNARRGVGLKSRQLSHVASQLELALIEGRPFEQIARLCIDAAALSLRLLEQGDRR